MLVNSQWSKKIRGRAFLRRTNSTPDPDAARHRRSAAENTTHGSSASAPLNDSRAAAPNSTSPDQTQYFSELARLVADHLLLRGEYQEARDLLEVALSQRLSKAHPSPFSCSEYDALRSTLSETIHAMVDSRSQSQPQLAQQNSPDNSLTLNLADAPSTQNQSTRAISQKLTDDFECILCLKLFHQPVTTSCGHSFCKVCLLRALDHTDACPVCRSVIHLDRTAQPVNVTLRNIILQNFPAEAEQRRVEEEAESHKHVYDSTSQMPLFPLSSVVLPGQNFQMHVWEPRYRLMLRRVLAGSGKFGLVSVRRQNNAYSPRNVGCVMQIERVEAIADGRSFVEAKAISRFQVLESWEVDGYMVGRLDPYDDNPQEVAADISNPALADLQRALRCRLNEILTRNQRPSFIRESIRRNGGLPEEDQSITTFSFWMASVLISDSEERQRILELRNPKKRLEAACARLEKIEATNESSSRSTPHKCVIM